MSSIGGGQRAQASRAAHRPPGDVDDPAGSIPAECVQQLECDECVCVEVNSHGLLNALRGQGEVLIEKAASTVHQDAAGAAAHRAEEDC
jgi:hypothetical protein